MGGRHGRVRRLKYCGGGAVRGSEGHPGDDMMIWHQKRAPARKKGTFPTITGGSPSLGTALIKGGNRVGPK